MEYDTAMDMSYKVAASIEDLQESIEGDLNQVTDAIGELTTLLANIFQRDNWREIFKNFQTRTEGERTYYCQSIVRYCDDEEVCKVVWFFGVKKWDQWDKRETEVFTESMYSAAILKVIADHPVKLDTYIQETAPKIDAYLKEESNASN
jgi:predicted RecB family endonuclease